jgi:uncharacterized membrane protein
MTLLRRQRLLTAVVLALAVLTVVGVAVLYPYGGAVDPQLDTADIDEDRFTGVITAMEESSATPPEFLLPGSVELLIDVRLDDGRSLEILTVDETGIFDVGQPVIVAQVSAPGTPELFQIVDLPRDSPLAALFGLFVVAVLLLGRWQGLRALTGLALSAVIIVGFLIPALLAGRNPTVVAVVAASAVIFATLPLSHGWSMTTRAAIAGTSVALLATIGLALLAVQAANLTGLSSEEVQLVRFATGQVIDVRGLLLAGIIVGTLGVLDDVTVSQASTVAALRRADPTAGDRAVFAAALRVGRDHIAATVNTLFLAYAGAALPLLILFNVGGGPISETLTSELVAQEIVRTLVGSIGLVLAVPLTTAVAAVVTDASTPVLHTHDAAEPPPAVDAGAAADRLPAADAPLRTDAVPAVEGDAAGPPPSAGRGGTAWEDSLRRSYGLGGPGGDGPGGSAQGDRLGGATGEDDDRAR